MSLNSSLRQIRTLLFLALFALTPIFASATVFTAIASGDWSNTLTWSGGLTPGASVSGADQVIIPLGLTVNLDADVLINNPLATVTLFGTLSSNSNQLTVTAGTVAGTGDLTVHQITVGASGLIIATGNVLAGIFETTSTSLVVEANLHIQNKLKISGGNFSLVNTGALLLDAGTSVELAGGNFISGSGTLQSAGAINLIYSGASQTSGAETTIGTIGDLTLNLSNANQNLTLNGNLTVTDSLRLQTGSLVIGNHDLIVKGSVQNTAQASLTGSVSSGLFLDGKGNVSLIFSQNGTLLDSLLVSQFNGEVTLTGDLTIGSSVLIDQSTLVLNGHNLTCNGVFLTAVGASITGGTTSGLFLNGTGDVTLAFTSDSAYLDTLLVSQMNSNVTLNSDLAIFSNLNLQEGKLVLNGKNLSVYGTFSNAVGASITGSNTSSLFLDGTGNVSLVFTQNGAVLDTILISQTNGDITLTSDLNVTGLVNIQQGSLLLNGNYLTVTGALTTAAGASITGSATSALVLDGNGNVSLAFSPGGALLNTFTVSQTNGNVILNSDLVVSGSTSLQQGSLVLNGNALTINGSLVTLPGASITGSATSDLFLDGTGNVSLSFALNGATLDSFLVSQTSGNVTLGTSLTVFGAIKLDQGSLLLNGHDLIVKGTLNTTAGATITGNSNSGLLLDGTGDISLFFSQNGALLNTFIVSQTTGNVTMNADLKVISLVDLQQGALVLNGNNLTVNGTLLTASGASITGSATSGLILDGTGNVSLAFTPNSALLNNIVVSQTNGNVSLNSNLTVGGTTNIQQGSLLLNGNNLYVNGALTTAAGASITGGATSGLYLDGTGNVSLIFSQNGALLDTILVSQTNGNVTLNSNLTVGGYVNLQQGSLLLNGFNLTVDGKLTTSAGASITGHANSGLFLNGSGNTLLLFSANGAMLDSISVNPSNGSVVLNTDLVVGSSVNLQQGALVLNSNDLTINGTLFTAPGASITGNAGSGLSLNGAGDVSLVFTQNSAILNSLLINQTNGNVLLNSDLTIGGNLNLQQGSLILNGNDVTVNGIYNNSGSASITGDIDAGLILNGTGTASVLFSLDGGLLNTFVVSQTGGNVILNSDLTVAGSIDLQQGALVLNGHIFTLNGTFTSAVGTSITGSNSSSLILDGTGNVKLTLTANGTMLKNFIVSQTGGDVTLHSNLVANSKLDLQQGVLVLNGYILTVNGTFNSAAGASISGSITSGLNLHGTGDVSLVFTQNTALLNTFSVNQTNGAVTLNANLTVGNTVDLQQGALVLNGNNLTIDNGTLTTAAGASITGSASSGLFLLGIGDVSLDFTANGATLDSLVVNQTNGDVTLNSDLVIAGSLALEQGNLIIGDNDINLSALAHLSGGSQNSYVVTDGAGTLAAFVNAGAAGVLFPCGSTDGYFPAVIAQGSGAANAQINVKVDQGVLAQGTTGADLSTSESLVNHTWFVGSTDAGAQLDLDFKFSWKAAAEVNGFNHNQCYISHFTNGAWDTQTVAAATSASGYFSISRDNITSLSPFRVADGDVVGTTEALLGGLQISPNPASDATPVVLKFDSPKAGTVQVRIFNTSGQLFYMETITLTTGANTVVLPTADLKAGIYWIDLRGEGQGNGVVRRFVKI